MKPEKDRINNKHYKGKHYKRNAFLFALFLILVLAFCIGRILYAGGQGSPGKFSAEEPSRLTAEIYQNGALLKTVDLSAVTESSVFTLTGENGCSNTIEVRPGSIGIISADCPDKLCVQQGFISDSLLPVTCLPNRLVIQIIQEENAVADRENTSPDVITY